MLISILFSSFVVFIFCAEPVYSACPIECTNPYEEYKCGSACQTTCENYGEECPIKSEKCTDACYCIEGYVRYEHGDCIPIDQCPSRSKKEIGSGNPIECIKPNEEYQCGSACQTTCTNLGQECPIQNKKCNDDCYCKKGYARNSTGDCIPIKNCPGYIECTRPNEEYHCGSACQTECATLGEQCPIINIRCNDACYCKDGYARNASGDCIPIKECPPKQCKKPNEEYQCGSACQTTCDTLGQECPIKNIKCNDDCYCKNGYARNSTGDCIPIKNCPGYIECTRPNEEYQCGSACQTECATLGEECPIINIKCNDACFCKKGYARNAARDCIPIKKCPPKPHVECNRPNEEYDCGSACQTTCETLGETCPIINVRCNDDCYCKEGFARNSTGDCIPIEECPPKGTTCTGPHEEYKCGSACQTTCENLGVDCPIKNIRCNYDCFCKEGYARNRYGCCIPIHRCPPKRKHNRRRCKC